MSSRKAKWVILFAAAVIFFNMTAPAFAGDGKSHSIDVEIANDLIALRPLSIEMVDKAILLILHVFPFFLTETNELRKARTLIHEYTHIALRVIDGPYFRPTSKSYAQLTPRRSWPSRLPLIGPLIRVIAANDTLHHPDAYAHFAVAVSGQPGALERYGDQSIDFTAVHYIENLRELERSNPVADSWAQQRG